MYELFLNGPSDLELRESAPLPALKKDEVRVKPTYGGICGSDIRVYNGTLAHARYPLCPGHEIIGTITGIGSDVVDINVGERIVVIPNSFCGKCEYCLQGKTNICIHKKSLGVNVRGGFAEEMIISSRYVMSVPDQLPDERAVLIEPFAVAVHAINQVNITPKSSVAILGCGTEGMLTIALAQYLGVDITAIDIDVGKLRKVQANYEGVATATPNELKTNQYDAVIEAAGVRASFEQSIDIVKPGGMIVLIGMTPQAEIPVMRIVRKEITLSGSMIYSIPRDFAESMDYLSDHRLITSPIISAFFPFYKYRAAYDYALSGFHGKVVLDFRGDRC